MTIFSRPSSVVSGRWIRRMPAVALGALAALTAVTTASRTAVAQDPNLIDQGQYDVRIGNRAAGTETFAIRRQGEGYMAVGRIQLEGAGAWLRSAKFGLRTNGSFSPMRYEIQAIGGTQSLIATRTGTRIRITTSSEEGERMTELLADPDQVLLGPGIAHHYYFLVRRLMSGDGSGLRALIPNEGEALPIRVAGTSDTTIRIGGAAHPARRYELSIGGVTHLVWADPADGRILRVEVPDRQWVSLRRGEN